MTSQNISYEVNFNGKSVLVAYLLWFFLGAFGVHRLYLNRTRSGLIQLILLIVGVLTSVLLIGYVFLLVLGVWWMLDVYFTCVIANEENTKLGSSHSQVSYHRVERNNDNLEMLEKLHSLFIKGILTEQEYEQKRQLLV